MTIPSRMALSVLASLLLAGCASQPDATRSPTPQAPLAAAMSRPTLNPCVSIVVEAGVFSQRFAEGLAAMRPLVLAQPFDSQATMAAFRAVSATLTESTGLEAPIDACPTASSLVTQVQSLRAAAEKPMDAALAASVTDGPTIRASAVQLLGLLKAALALLSAVNTLATSLGVVVALAEVPGGATKPIGSLPPFSTSRPTPRPAAQRTAQPTQTTGSSASSGGSGSSSAYRAAVRYLDSVQATYTQIDQTSLDLWGFVVDGPGFTPAEVAANKEAAAIEFAPAVRLIQSHLSFMAGNTPRCLKDAYSVDKPLVIAWRSQFKSYIYPSDLLPGNRAASYDWQDLQSKVDAFFARLSSYVADCR